ncbi:hypothetical protein P12x_002269 [Tundrisphaera lichenicola]|uniref:hypothetical protein n=1 Tax=Tundrisphaera lichenicola TaxID=2029860 RepID=UPI003EBE51B1
MPDQSPHDPKPIADAASLFDTDEIRPYSAPPIAEPAQAAVASDGYDLAIDPLLPASEEPPRPVALPVPVERPRSRPAPKPKARPADPSAEDPSGSREFEAEISEVDPIWTRGAEWGSDLVRIAAAGLVVLILLYFTLGTFGPFFLILFLGGAALAVLSYPLLITLERPVRITPEQAVTDFFAAASHHVPHYRRMWLLLSSAGRDSGPFPDFEAFREHWKDRVAGWRSSLGGGKYAPLIFEIGDFQADKSTGKTTSKANYTVRVSLRGDSDARPAASYRMSHGLVKGPDRMWYLNRGALPTTPG